MEQEPMPNVVRLTPRAHELITVIRELAKASGNVGFSNHATSQLLARGLTEQTALRALRIGEIVGEIEAG